MNFYQNQHSSRRVREGHVAKLAKFLREKIGHVSAHAFDGRCEDSLKEFSSFFENEMSRMAHLTLKR